MAAASPASPARTPTGAPSGGSESRTRSTASVISRQPNSSLKLMFAASAILHQREPAGASGRTRAATAIPAIIRLVRTIPRMLPAAAGDRVSNHRSPQTGAHGEQHEVTRREIVGYNPAIQIGTVTQFVTPRTARAGSRPR